MQPEVPQNEKTAWIDVKRMLGSIRRRPFMKLSALLIAFVFWAVLIASDPALTREKTILNVPVQIAGVDALRTKGFIVMEDLTSEPITVKMRVEVRQSEYDQAGAQTFSPRIDLSSQISAPGPQRVKITASGTVLSIEPEYIDVTVEPYTIRRIPVNVERVGESAQPLWIDAPTPDPSLLTVSGPKSIVDRILRAVVPLPMDSLSTERPDDTLSNAFELKDKDGNTVSSPLLRITNESIAIDAVSIHVNVYPAREIPVSADSAVTGTPAHGYRLGEVRITPDTVLIAAEQDVLDSIDMLHVLDPLDISGDSVRQGGDARLRTVSGVVHSSVNQVFIEADIVPATHVHTYVNLPVTVMGLSPELSARLSYDVMDAVISGPYASVEGLTADAIHLSVDATGLSEGVHLLDVRCSVNGTETYSFEPEFPRLTLTLTKTAAP